MAGNESFVTEKVCSLKHKEVDTMREEVNSQRKLLWGLVVLHIATLGSVITALFTMLAKSG